MKLSKNVILLVNLGSPNFPKVAFIRQFLAKFLGDRRVVNLPKVLWFPILYGIILPIRATKLAKSYQDIWLNGMSPLAYYTQRQAEKLQAQNTKVIVKYAFSYSTPAIDAVLQEVHELYTVDKITVIPLYPQFSSTTVLPVFDTIARFYGNKLYLPKINFVNEFHQDDLYIEAIANAIRLFWGKNGKGDKLILSYHGLPQSLVAKGDAYFVQCVATTKLIVSKLGILESEYILAFQSKFGKQKWLLPATNLVLEELAINGVKSVDVVCPGFVSDCLETLEEIAIMNKAIYLYHGGHRYNYIPCLNDSDEFIRLLSKLSID